MPKKKISLRNDASAAEVLDVARNALEKNGYLWVPQGPNRAEAHQGGKEITHKAFTFKLRLGVEVEGDKLVLHNVSNGIGFAGSIGSGAGVAMIRKNLRRSARAVEGALTKANLA